MSRLQLRIEGEQGQITLEAFVQVLNRARLVIEDIDSAVSEQPRGAFEWVITDLAMGSAIAEVEPRPRLPQADERLGLVVGHNFVSGLDSIERGDEHLPPYFTDTGLGRVKWIAQTLGRAGIGPFHALLNGGVGASATITEQAAVNVARLVEPRSTAIGSVSGNLEMISVHGPARYNVYDALTRRAVRCTFPRERLEEVASALGRRVLVSGIVHRNQFGEPVKVERGQLGLLRSDAELPSTRDIAGLVPDLTGELASDEYVRRLRNG